MSEPTNLFLQNEAVWADPFSTLFSEHQVAIEPDGLSLSGRFLHLSPRAGALEDLVEVMVDSIVDFCIPVSKRSGASVARLEELRRIAARSFIKSDKARSRSGEPGELILYLLLERMLGAPKIASKMYLKTSPNMPVHGCDAIHARRKGGGELGIELFWGESKLHADLQKAIKDAAESIAAMQPGSMIHNWDVTIVRENLDRETLDDDFRELLLETLDPYAATPRLGPILFDHTACFVGFNSRTFAQLCTTRTDAFRRAFLEDYAARVCQACTTFGNHARQLNIQELNYTLLLLPLESVAQLRRIFFDRLDGIA